MKFIMTEDSGGITASLSLEVSAGALADLREDELIARVDSHEFEEFAGEAMDQVSPALIQLLRQARLMLSTSLSNKYADLIESQIDRDLSV
jgi:hypothetical protein